jgi:hypothetical protein
MAPEAIEILDGQRTSPPSYELVFNPGVYLLKNDPVAALESYDQARPGSTSVGAAPGGWDRRTAGELRRSLSYWVRAKKIQPDNPEFSSALGESA